MATNSIPSDSSGNTNETISKNKDELLNDILTCAICLSRMSSPCCLPCAHSFCRSCLLDYAKNNNTNTLTPTNYILCPYCKFQLNFRSFEHFESMLIINPILKRLCEALDESVFNSDQSQNQTNGQYRARCHACCLLKMLKICKHCYFMLCDTCRRTHLLDVHRESRIQLDILDSYLSLVYEKRLQLDQLAKEYETMRENIKSYAEKLIHEIEQQRDHALQILNERQCLNDQTFWTKNGFTHGEKLDFFVQLLETGKKKLAAKNITDKELIEISDNLQTVPDVNQNLVESINFAKLSLELDETFQGKKFIYIYDNSSFQRAANHFEESTSGNQQTDSNQS